MCIHCLTMTYSDILLLAYSIVCDMILTIFLDDISIYCVICVQWLSMSIVLNDESIILCVILHCNDD